MGLIVSHSSVVAWAAHIMSFAERPSSLAGMERSPIDELKERHHNVASQPETTVNGIESGTMTRRDWAASHNNPLPPMLYPYGQTRD